MDVILKRFENPDEAVHFEKGKFETVAIGGMTICLAPLSRCRQVRQVSSARAKGVSSPDHPAR